MIGENTVTRYGGRDLEGYMAAAAARMKAMRVRRRVRSQIMVDTPVTERRERVGLVVGRLAVEDVGRLNVVLAFVIGLGG